ncbi:MAG: hypothetical protein QOF76_2631 [Solirubrobacteraceae bacterium]|nr:hypothetical protein [Solirubrobacteraceae bacterium]
MGPLDVRRWAAAADIAAAQHGRITTRQLREDCGIGKRSIAAATRSGRLFREHVGVYALGHPGGTDHSAWMSAVLAGGVDAQLSVFAAASHWRLLIVKRRLIDVTVPPNGTRERPGIRFHYVNLTADERMVHLGIPVTSPARTAVDMAHALGDPDDVHRLLREMQFQRRFDIDELDRANARRPSRLLTQVINDLRPTDSPIEDRFKSGILRRYRVPEPLYQCRVEGFRVDFYWPQARLIVEIDGTGHAQPAMRQADANRDNLLHLAGYLVLRYTAADLRRRHAWVAEQILRALRMRTP